MSARNPRGRTFLLARCFRHSIPGMPAEFRRRQLDNPWADWRNMSPFVCLDAIDCVSNNLQPEFPLYSPHSWSPCHGTSQTCKTFLAFLALPVLFLAYLQDGELIGRVSREDKGIEEEDLQTFISSLPPSSNVLYLPEIRTIPSAPLWVPRAWNTCCCRSSFFPSKARAE